MAANSVILAVIAALGAGPQPTAAEVQAGYIQNLVGFGSVRITFRVRPRYEAAYRQDQIAQLAALEQAIKDPNWQKESGLRGSVEQKISALQQYVHSTEPYGDKPIPLSEFFEDVWTDRQTLQVRAPAKIDFADGFAFPERPIHSPADLVEGYSEVAILTWSASREPKTWVWKGVDPADGTPLGAISDALPEEIFRFRLPPVGLLNPSWASHEVSHLADQLLAGPLEGLKIEGKATLDGRELLIVERVQRMKAGVGKAFSGSEVTLRGWVDPTQGFLPLRIELTLQQVSDGKVTGPKSAPIQIVRLSSMQNYAGAGYYPSAGTHEYRQLDHRGPHTPDGDVKSGEPSDGLYTYQTEDWSVDSIAHHQTIPAETFAVAFPDRTRYFDYTENRFSVAGKPQIEIDHIMALKSAGLPIPESPPPPGPRNSRAWLLVLNIAVVLLLVVFVVRRKRMKWN